MQNHILLFHVGMHKTGTTSLQRFLYDNDAVLRKYGWAYPDIYSDNYSTFCNGKKLFWRERDLARWENIKKELQNYNIIVSCEAYWRAVHKLLEALSIAQTFCNNIKVIVYLRRQDRAVESMYNQQVKVRSEHGSIIDYMNKRSMWSTDYLNTLDIISDKIGRENVIVRVYEKEQFEGERNDIFSDFICSLPDGPVSLNWDELLFPEKQNLSLSGNILEIKKICNSIYEDHNTVCCSKKLISELVRISNIRQNYTSTGMSTGYFTKQERIDLLNSQAQNNSEIAKKYLNRADGKLFYDDFVDYPVYQNQATGFEKDIILTLYSMLCLQQRKIEMAPVVAAVALLRKEKKLAFWGFGDNGKQLYNYALLPDIIIDNDPNKCHRTFMEIPVVPSAEIGNWEEYFIVVTPTSSKSIEDFLLKIGLKKGENYIMVNDFFDYLAIY